MGHPKGQKRDFDALERRRMEALRLFRKGIPQAQIARQLKVARQTVSRWVRQYREGGKAALRKAARRQPGRKRLSQAPFRGPVGERNPCVVGGADGAVFHRRKDSGP